MNLIGALIGGVVGGLIGAAVWAGIAYGTGYEIGWIAWGVGFLVGLGTAMGAKGQTNVATGVLAAVVALASVLAGKYASIELSVNNGVPQSARVVTIDDDKAMVHLANSVVKEYEAAGKRVTWPEGQSIETAEAPEHYPKNVWTDASGRWGRMSPEEQQSYKETLRLSTQAFVDARMSEYKQEAFLGSFGLFDILFFGLALVTAFQIGQAGTDGD